MSDNPYASPVIYQAELIAPPSRMSARRLSQINQWLKRAQTAFLGVIGSAGLMIFLPDQLAPAPIVALLVCSFGLWICISMLACDAYHVPGAVIATILYMIPVINIFVFLAVHDRAVRVLKAHGFARGFLAMKPATNEAMQTATDSYNGEMMVVATKPGRSRLEVVITWAIIAMLLALVALPCLID